MQPPVFCSFSIRVKFLDYYDNIVTKGRLGGTIRNTNRKNSDWGLSVDIEHTIETRLLAKQKQIARQKQT